MTGQRSTDLDRPQLIVRANAGLRAFMALLVLASAFMTLVIAPNAEPLSQQLPFAAVSAAIGVGPLLMGSTKIVLRGDRLKVVNPVFVHAVDLEDIAYLDHHNGFEVVVRSGRRIGFAGSAPSLIGTISRYWSARRMIDRIDAATGRTWTTPSGWEPGERPVTRRLRTTAVLWCITYVVGGTASALGIVVAIH